MPGKNRWDRDDVINLDGLESDVDELKMSDHTSDRAAEEEVSVLMSKEMEIAVSQIAIASHRSPSPRPSTLSSDMYNLQIPKEVHTKTISDESSTEPNNSPKPIKNNQSCAIVIEDSDDELIAVSTTNPLR